MAVVTEDDSSVKNSARQLWYAPRNLERLESQIGCLFPVSTAIYTWDALRPMKIGRRESQNQRRTFPLNVGYGGIVKLDRRALTIFSLIIREISSLMSL